MDKQTAIEKIRKCMALAKSSNPHEAATALRQAQKLIEQFKVDAPEILAAGVSEDWAKSGATSRPTQYEVVLARMVADAFSCELLFRHRIGKTSTHRLEGGYSFIGVPPMPEIASYTFTVLARQLKKARKEYLDTALKRYRKNKTAAADTFCAGWVLAVRSLVSQVVPSAEQAEAIQAYLGVNYPDTTSLDQTRRSLTNPHARANHYVSGVIEGRNARLNGGVSTNRTELLGQ